MYGELGISNIEIVFPDFTQGWAPEAQDQKQKEGEKHFQQTIAARIRLGDRLVAVDSESNDRIKEILSWDITAFWKEKWLNWKRDGAPYYDQPVGSFKEYEVWLLCESLWTILTDDLSREEAIRRMCDPKDSLKFSKCGFGSANWTEFAENFGQSAFQGTDQEEQFDLWYKQGWEAFEKIVDGITRALRPKREGNQ